MRTQTTPKLHIGIFFDLLETHKGATPLNSNRHIGQTRFRRNTALAIPVDLNGNRSSMTDPTGTQTYEYDALNRLTKITNPFGEVTTFQYDAIGRRTGMNQHNGATTTYSYDDAGRLLSLINQIGATNISTFSYTYDNVGNRNSMTDIDGSHNYVYDQLYRLVDATHPQPENPAENFNYDQVGNRTDSHKSTTYTVDNMNRLLEDENYTYTYDSNGNSTQKTDKAVGEVDKYTYDSENRLAGYKKYSSATATVPTTQATYNYDGMGRRIAKTVDGELTKYIYDDKDILLDLDANDRPVARYTRGKHIDDIISVSQDSDNNGTLDLSYYYHRDGLASVTEITNNTGAIVQTYKYDTFGNISFSNGSISNRYTFTGREWESESEIYYYRARFYDPGNGRFISEDPINFIAGVNFYSYVNNNPVNFVDPQGLFWSSIKNAIGGALTPSGLGNITGSMIGSGLGAVAGAAIGGQLGMSGGFALGGALGLGGGPLGSLGGGILGGISGALGGGLTGGMIGGKLGGKIGQLFDNPCAGQLNCNEPPQPPRDHSC